MTTGLVSVFMPAYNHEAYIEEAIDSVLAQDYRNFRLIIGDDCSTDATWSIIQRYQQAHPDLIDAYRNATNLGISGNCTKLLQRCDGEFVAFHAGDDVWLPPKLSAQVALMQADPRCALAYHDVEVFDSASGAILYTWNKDPGRPQPVVGKADYVARKVVEVSAGFMGALSVMIRRSFLAADIGYDPRLPSQGELLIWLNVLRNANANVVFAPQVLARYRKHDKGISQSNNRTEEGFFLAIVEHELVGYANSVRRARGRTYYSMGVESVLAGDGNAALSYLVQCLRYSPYSVKLPYWLMRAVKLKWMGEGQSELP